MHRALWSILLAVGALAPPATGAPAHAPAKPRGPVNARTGLVELPLSALVGAVARGDHAEVARVAERLGPARLAEALEGPDRTIAAAALEAAPLLPGAARLVEAVADRVDGRDDTVAAAAARALGRILDGRQPDDLADWDVGPETLSRACGALRALALKLEAPASARVAALEATAQAAASCTASGELVTLARDPVPAVRRATALVLRPNDRAPAGALRELLRDTDAEVAAAAAAALCRAAGGKADADLRAAARRLVREPAAPREDAVDMLACFATSADPADRKLLDDLRRGPASALRTRAAELAGSGDTLRPSQAP